MEKGVPVRAISRGFAALEAINLRNSMTMTEVSKAINVPYPTACRIVQTLVHEGFVEQEPNRKRYRTTVLVRSLSNGYRLEDEVAGRARGHMEALTEEFSWPVSLLTRVGSRMVVIDSTHCLTSSTFINYHPGDSIPFYETASGKVWLAFCSEQERGILLNEPIEPQTEPDGSTNFFRFAGEVVESVRENGYALHSRCEVANGSFRSTTIAVPVFRDGQLITALALTFFSAALRRNDAVEQFAGKLIRNAQLISSILSRG